jgi:hypothetical protein
MPQFVLDMRSAEATRMFQQADGFTQSYVTAAFWMLEERAVDFRHEKPPAWAWSLDDLVLSSWGAALLDCARFQGENHDALETVYNDYPNYDQRRAGHDFWMSRNNSGFGFRERGLGKWGETLGDAAREWDGMDLCIGDGGKLYFGVTGF